VIVELFESVLALQSIPHDTFDMPSDEQRLVAVWLGYSVESIKWPYLHRTCSGFCSQDPTGFLQSGSPLVLWSTIVATCILSAGIPEDLSKCFINIIPTINLERKPAQKRGENLAASSCCFNLLLRQREDKCGRPNGNLAIVSRLNW
jgi:hypothetical protein